MNGMPDSTALLCCIYARSETLCATRRYHYNVSTDRLQSHVKKGWDQGLYISSATSNQSLWALVMDEATGFSKQSYKVSDSFLPKSWCLAQWDAGFYITAVAGLHEYHAHTIVLWLLTWLTLVCVEYAALLLPVLKPFAAVSRSCHAYPTVQRLLSCLDPGIALSGQCSA